MHPQNRIRSVLVTGGATGIGNAVMLTLARTNVAVNSCHQRENAVLRPESWYIQPTACNLSRLYA